jgi:hypothetical protein
MVVVATAFASSSSALPRLIEAGSTFLRLALFTYGWIASIRSLPQLSALFR